MSTKKQTAEQLLGLTSKANRIPEQPTYTPTRMTQEGVQLTRKQRRLVAEHDTQQLKIEIRRRLTVSAENAVSDVERHVASQFYHTIEYMLDLENQAQDPRLREYMEAYNEVSLPAYSRAAVGIREMGKENIGRIMQEPLDIPPPRRPVSLAERIFGVKDEDEY